MSGKGFTAGYLRYLASKGGYDLKDLTSIKDCQCMGIILYLLIITYGNILPSLTFPLEGVGVCYPIYVFKMP